MDKNLLKNIMLLHDDTIQILAKELGISHTTLLAKICENGNQFNQGEITRIKDRYNLTPGEVDNIFFTDLVTFTRNRKLPRMRSIKETAKYFKDLDPETQITESTIRRLISEGTIPVVKSGVKFLLNLDLLIDYLSGENQISKEEE
ncbi:MAG: hypothetical protein ACK5JH_06975 [Anaerocolumna sp.]